MKGNIIINSRKELKGLLDWYDELLHTKNRRNVITSIYQAYRDGWKVEAEANQEGTKR